MGGVAKAIGGLFGGRKGGSASAPTIVQPGPATGAPAAEAAAAVAPPEGTPTSPQAGATGSMGAAGAKKSSSSRRRGRLETLLTEMGGSIERFGD